MCKNNLIRVTIICKPSVAEGRKDIIQIIDPISHFSLITKPKRSVTNVCSLANSIFTFTGLYIWFYCPAVKPYMPPVHFSFFKTTRSTHKPR